MPICYSYFIRRLLYQLVLFMLASERILYVMGSLLYQNKSIGREFLIRPGF